MAACAAGTWGCTHEFSERVRRVPYGSTLQGQVQVPCGELWASAMPCAARLP